MERQSSSLHMSHMSSEEPLPSESSETASHPSDATAFRRVILHRTCGVTLRAHPTIANEFQRQRQRAFLDVQLNIRNHTVLIQTHQLMVMPRQRIHRRALETGASSHFANPSQFCRLPQNSQKNLRWKSGKARTDSWRCPTAE